MFLNQRRFLVNKVQSIWDLKLSFLAEVEDNDDATVNNEKADLEVEKDLMKLMNNGKGSPVGSDYLNLFGAISNIRCILPFGNCKKQKKPASPKKKRNFDVFDKVSDDYYGNYFGFMKGMKGKDIKKKKA